MELFRAEDQANREEPHKAGEDRYHPGESTLTEKGGSLP
jgi:hypothetical protein